MKATRRAPKRTRRRQPSVTLDETSFVEDPALAIVLIVLGCLALAVEIKSEAASAGGPLLFLALCGSGGYVLARAMSAARRDSARGTDRRMESPLERRHWVAVKKEGMLLAGFASYTLYFFPLWAPFTLPKVVLALGLLFGTAYTLGVGRTQEGDPHRRRRDGYTPGERTARARSAWPRYRGFVAMVTGVAVVCIGTWQGWRPSAGIAGSSLLSYLCWIVSLMFGVSFFILGIRHLRMDILGLLVAIPGAAFIGFGACLAANRQYQLPLDPDALDRPTSSGLGWIFIGALVGVWAIYVLFRVYSPWHRGRERMSNYVVPFE